jgi:hypothetical protein
MSATGQRLNLRLFVEGVEIPCISASVQCAPNSPAMCSIQIPPLAQATDFLPRSVVHVFFLDLFETTSPFVTNSPSPVSAKNQQNPTTYQQALESDQDVLQTIQNQKYKLFFGGEYVGFTWTKNASNRSMVMQCVDFSNYWDYAYQWNNTDLFGPGIKAMFSGGATNLFTDFLSDEGSAIVKIIQQPSAQYPNLKGLLGGIVHLLEAVGGSYYYGKQFAGENLFFSLAELRLHITQMITAYEADPTASRLLNADGYDGLFGRTLGGLGQQVSIRQAINALMSIIFHETYSIPTPLYVPGTSGTISGTVRKPIANDPRYSGIAANANNIVNAINDVESSLQDAAGGALTSSDVGGADLGSAKDSLLARLQAMYTTLKGTILTATDKQVQPVKGYLSSALRAIGQAKTLSQKWTPSANSNQVSAIVAQLDTAKSQLQRVAEFSTTQTGATKGVPARLNTQIFRPDVWFTAPPRCNVLFPEHYNNFTYQRSFLQEPTRFLLKTNDEFFGEDELFDAFYFAPKAFTVKSQQRTLQSMLSNDVLDHELFTGILPIFEKMGELNIFAARSGTVKGKVPKVGLAQRSTNFLYFKHRFAARQAQVTGRFNPYVAPGFPGLVIDKWVDAQSLSDRQALIDKYGTTNTDINKLLGTHFLGNFTEVEHVVDQQAGRTSIVLSYPRQPDEGVEFLGATQADQTVQRRFGNDALRSTDVAAMNPPKALSIGPNYGQIVQVTDVTAQYKGTSDGNGPLLPLYDGPRRQGTGEAAIKVPVGIELSANGYGPGVTALVGDPTQLITFRAYRIQEQVPRYRQETVDLPAEEYIRPGWYGDCWHPAVVGKVYQSYFGIGAITDFQQVTDAGGASVGVPYQQAEDALAEAANGIDWSDPRTQAPALLTLDQNSSIQAAVGFLVQTYSYAKLAGNVDIDAFISSYVWRPVASMVDLFGSSDLQLSADGHVVVQGIEGFHSRAFGSYNDLFGLITSDLDSIVGIKRGSTAAQRADTRKRKQDAVKAYVAALQYARAILG